jgi:hypothetical protein
LKLLDFYDIKEWFESEKLYSGVKMKLLFLIFLSFVFVSCGSDLDELKRLNPRDDGFDAKEHSSACGDAECGVIDGVSCGQCEDDLVCGNDNKCYDPCAGKECGEIDGVNCGKCEESSICIQSECKEDGTFIYEHNGLYWSDIAAEKMDHVSAGLYCEHLGGRLPTINELRALIKNCSATETGGVCGVNDKCLSSDCWSAACDGCSFDDSGIYSVFDDNGWFWSSSVRSDDENDAWDVSFSSGRVGSSNRGDIDDVRCVR